MGTLAIRIDYWLILLSVCRPWWRSMGNVVLPSPSLSGARISAPGIYGCPKLRTWGLGSGWECRVGTLRAHREGTAESGPSSGRRASADGSGSHLGPGPAQAGRDRAETPGPPSPRADPGAGCAPHAGGVLLLPAHLARRG